MLKRVLAVSLVASVLAIGCASQQPAPAANDEEIRRAEEAARRAEEAARQAEAASEKSEVIYHKNLQK